MWRVIFKYATSDHKGFAMNEKILQLLEGRAELYPHTLESQFPRILSKILELWPTEEAENYFKELLIDDRGDRQGFPPKAASEIIHLSLAHSRQQLRPQQHRTDLWEVEAPPNKAVIERDGIVVARKSLMDAAEAGELDTVHEILMNSNDELNSTDARHWTPLIVASFNGHDLVTRLLLEFGADTDAQDKSGYTALHWAAYNGQARTSALLLQEGAKVNARSHSGWTPLMQAASRNQQAVVDLLIGEGADVNLSSQDGSTALIKAAANGHLDVVKFLLSKGADPTAQLKDGNTALSLAIKNGHSAVEAVLEPVT